MTTTFTRKLLCALALSLLSAAASAYVALPQDKFIRLCVFPNSSPSRDDIAGPDNCAASGGVIKLFPALFNKAFSGAYSAVTRGIVFVHGDGANPNGGYNAIVGDFKGTDADTTWVVAPQFMEVQTNGNPQSGRSGYLHWSREVPNTGNAGYNLGDATVHPAGTHVSAFDLVDNLITRMVKQAPNLTAITVIGHSAGSRFLNRYSLGTQIDQGPIAGRNITVRFVMASAGAYTYLTGTRYHTPNGVSCPNTYDDYPYGLSDVPAAPHYMSDLVKADMIAKIKTKRRLYIVGELDNDPADPSHTCEAQYQGTHRVDRAQTYWQHLVAETATTNALFCIAPDATHSPKLMIGSDAVDHYWHGGTINPADCMPQ